MAARTTRQKARQRILAMVAAALDRVIPQDPDPPLRGGTFGQWEDQAGDFSQAITTALLEERAALEDTARVQEGGRCPFCSSTQVYLERRVVKREVQTPHGKVVLEQQRCRCRSCDRTFSPSGA